MLALSAIFLNLLLSKQLVNSDHRLSEVAHGYGIRTIKSSCLKKRYVLTESGIYPDFQVALD